MRPAQMDVTLGNQRRKKAAAALLAQMQSGGATAGLGGVRQTGGLARAGAKMGIIRGQGRGIPAGLEGLYARAGDFARQNQLGDFSLNAEQQPNAQDPGVYAGGYASANAAPVTDPGGQGGQIPATAQDPGAYIPAAPVGSTPFVTGQPGGAGQGGVPTGDPERNAFIAGKTDVDPFAVGGTPQDGQPMNGGVYYQGTIIPMGVWRAIQQS